MPRLKAFYKTKEEIPEALREMYTQGEGGLWVLDADIEDHPGVTGLRNTVTATRTERENLKRELAKYEGLDLDLVERVLAEHAAIEEGELLKKGDIDGIVAKRTEAMRKDFEKTIEQLTGSNKTATEKLRTLLVDNSLTKAAAALGVKASAMEDFLARGQRVFVLDESGNVIAKDRDGNTIFGKDGRTSMTPEEWAQSIAPNIGHLLEASAGGGVKDGAGRQGGGFAGKVVASDDAAGFGANLEAIAKGEVKVV